MKKTILCNLLLFVAVQTYAQTGKAGIGTTTPHANATLHVDGASDNTNATPNAAQQANDFIVRNDGRVGIGTTNPGAILDVNGDILVVNKNDGSNNGFVFGGRGGPGAANAASFIRPVVNGAEIFDEEIGYDIIDDIWTVEGSLLFGGFVLGSSDRRLKSNIVPISYGLNEINKLQPKQYIKYKNFEHTGEGHEEMGFIAQDLKKIMPELVHVSKGEDKKHYVKYDGIIPVLVQAIQDLKAEVDILKDEVGILKSQIENNK